MLLHPCPYEDIPKQPWNPMLASVNPLNSAVSKSQPSQPNNPEARVYGSNTEVWKYVLLPAGHMVKMVQLPCVYNYPPWEIQQLTTNELATLWDVPLLLQEKSEELDKKSLLVQYLTSVLGKKLLLASDYLIILRIRGAWCSMPRIDLKVEVQDTLIQQVLSTSVPSPLPMMEDEVAGSILKAYGKKEYDAAPPVALWDSWLYRSWKADRDMMSPLAENWQHLLGIFWKFSLRWWK